MSLMDSFPQKGLMYVSTHINGEMVSNGYCSLSQFLCQANDQVPQLKFNEQTSSIKVVNSQTQSVSGMTYAVDIK